MADWIGVRIGVVSPTVYGTPEAARPWWRFSPGSFSIIKMKRREYGLPAVPEDRQWRRNDGIIVNISGTFDQEDDLDRLSEFDRANPMPRPPVRAGQVWVFDDGSQEEPPMFLVTGSGPLSFDWLDGEVVRRADVERVEFLLTGWVLVTGPSAPWGPP